MTIFSGHTESSIELWVSVGTSGHKCQFTESKCGHLQNKLNNKSESWLKMVLTCFNLIYTISSNTPIVYLRNPISIGAVQPDWAIFTIS